MANRTQIVCLCEGVKGASIDEVFINKLVRTIRPSWVKLQGTNFVRIERCGSRGDVIGRMPTELKNCLHEGGTTTLMVWADCDDNCADPQSLKEKFWQEAQRKGILKPEFEQAVFIFAKDRLENWIEFLQSGSTVESIEGPRVKHNRAASDAAKKLGDYCKAGKPVEDMPDSLKWSCKNWRALVARMK